MTRVLLVDDHEVARIGLKKIVLDVFPETIFGEAGTIDQALESVRERDWELIIIDLSTQHNRGLDALKEIKRINPKAALLVVTSLPEQQYAFRAIKAGAVGYIHKTSTSGELQNAVRKVAGGGRYLSVSLAETLSSTLGRKDAEHFHEMLSDREFQVMRLIGSGKTVGEIAAILVISDKTVSTYRARILDKTGLKNNAEVVRYVVENGLLD